MATKAFTIERKRVRDGTGLRHTGTLPELIQTFSYTLDVGRSWQHEKGNAKINCKPGTIASLVKNLNNAVNNAASNGYAGVSYTLVTDDSSVL